MKKDVISPLEINNLPDFMEGACNGWDYIEQQFMLIEVTAGNALASRKYALARPKKTNAAYYYGAYIPPRRTEDTKLLEDALKQEHEYLEKVRKHIKRRKLTHDFIADWGMLNYFNGITTLAWNAKDDDLQQARSAKGNAKTAKKLWVAHVLLKILQEIDNRPKAESRLIKHAKLLRDGLLICPDSAYSPEWFGDLLAKDQDGLKTQYRGGKFDKPPMLNFIEMHADVDIPPIDLSAYKKPPP